MPLSRRAVVWVVIAAVAFGSCADDDVGAAALDATLTAAIQSAVDGGAQALRLPASDDYEAIPQDPRNPLTPEKVALGRLLFHETALGVAGVTAAMAGTYSCASCHRAESGFQAGRHQGIGEGGVGEARSRAPAALAAELDVQPVRSLSILHAGYQRVSLWNGQFGSAGPNADTEAHWTPGTPKATNALGYEGVETQAIAGMQTHRLDVDTGLLDDFGYRPLFDDAFAELPADQRYSRTTAALAIAAYERTVLATRAPFQAWLAGDPTAMSAAEKRGAIVFFGDGACATCHTGPALASETFHALGLADLHDAPEPTFGSADGMAAHRGRGGFTMRTSDMYAFKTPQLYNLADSEFYGHGASLRTLRDVVAYKVAAVPENDRVPSERLAEEFRPLALTTAQQEDLVAFLSTGLRDGELQRYTPGDTSP